MAYKLNPRDVLAYLNELGYNNVNAQQLKEFMQDLKKLIKYERRLSRANSTPKSDADTVPCRDTDIFDSLYSQGTVESKAKTVPKKQNVISVQIKRPKLKTASDTHCARSDCVTTITKENEPLDSKRSSGSEKVLVEKDVQTEAPESVRDVATQKSTQRETKRKATKPKSAFIRPAVPVKIKGDPVALYHQYQAEWKRIKIPGEDNRADLRWAIREKMMGVQT